MTDIRRTAVHEAGHVLIARLHNVKVVKVEVFLGSPTSWGGKTSYLPGRVPPKTQIKIALGGRCTEEMLLGAIDDANNVRDLMMIFRNLDFIQMCDEHKVELLLDLRAEVYDCILANRAIVMTIADALVDRLELNGYEIGQFI